MVDYHDLPEIFRNAWDTLEIARSYFEAYAATSLAAASVRSSPNLENEDSKSEQSNDQGTGSLDLISS